MTWPSELRRQVARLERAPAGFTLIELLVVLAICAAVIAVLPRAFAGIERYRLHAAEARLAETLRILRLEALRTGNATSLTIDAARRRYRIDGRQSWVGLSGEVSSLSFEANAPVQKGELFDVTFFPDGSARGGALLLRQGTTTAAIYIDWLTGRVLDD